MITFLGQALQPPDPIDSAFSFILGQIEKASDFGFDNGFGELFPKVKTIASRIDRILNDMYQAALGDEANFLKHSLVDIGQQGGLGDTPSFFDNPLQQLYGVNREERVASGSENSLNKRLTDLDTVVTRYEKQSDDYRKLPQNEKQKVVEKNRKAYSQLSHQHTKLLKRCYYTRTRIEYLLNELYSENKNKNLTERLSVWKRFIENNEYVLNQPLTRSERDLLYSFLAKKLRDTEPDIQDAEEIVFAFV